jgi:Zn-dependent protease
MNGLLGLQVDFAEGLVWYFVFLYSTTLHEAAHAWAADRLGDDTARRSGQVSLDPIPHIVREPMGMVVVPVLSWFLNGGGWMMGWASAPYDPVWAMRYPRRAAWMAAAGPASNLVLLLLALGGLRLGLESGVFVPVQNPDLAHIVAADAGGRAWEFLATLLNITFALQVVLVPFNLLPVPPLDGSALPLLFLPRRAAIIYQEFLQNSSVQTFGMLVAWQVSGKILPHAFHGALRLLYF